MQRSLIDPAAAVAVLLAAAPGTYAVFVGSGVSAPVVPTGGELRRQTLALLYRAQERQLPADNEDLDRWWQSRSSQPATYSAMLAAAFPTMEERRHYLASFFEGTEPTPAHRALAQLAKKGLVKVFLTTNFDRLLEKALEAEGVSVTSVALGEHVAAAAPREHAEAYVLKLHGDYGTQRIRNTDTELESLDPEINTELELILSRYGLILLGYSGEDPAVRAAILRRGTRYGLYWVVRGAPTERQRQLLSQLGGQAIAADGAGAFVEDLNRRIAALLLQPQGRSPAQEYRESLQLLIARDPISVDGRRRRLEGQLISAVREWLKTAAARQSDFPTEIRATGEYESWRPFYGSILAMAGPALDSFTAAATASIEAMSDLVATFAEGLVAVFNLGGPDKASTTWVGNTPRLVARLGGDIMLSRAIALSRWDSFYRAAAPTMVSRYGRAPWVMHPDYTAPDALGGHAAIAGNWSRALVPANSLWQELGLELAEAEAALCDSNFLLSISELAWSERSGEHRPVVCWGLIRRPEPAVLRQLAGQPAAVNLIARLAGEEASVFRSSLSARIRMLLQILNSHYPGFWHISEDASAYVRAIAETS